MRVAALFSGGKDSMFSIYIAQQYGWDVTPLVTLASENKDSWMFHSINIHLTEMLAETLGIPLVKHTTKGEKEREVQDLQDLLRDLPIDGVISGAIASEYQRTRIERVCDQLGIKSFTPLWHKKPEILLRDQLHAGFQSIIVGVFANGFDDTWLGTPITEETVQKLLSLRDRFGINVAGEGGEFETLVLDGPTFKKKLVIDETGKEWHRDSGVLQVKRAHLQDR